MTDQEHADGMFLAIKHLNLLASQARKDGLCVYLYDRDHGKNVKAVVSRDYSINQEGGLNG